MYCICCKRNNVFPSLRDSDYKTEEDALWGKKTFVIGDIGEEVTKETNINSGMIDDGIINTISAGYGSRHDTQQFIIAICDECIDKNLEDNTLLYYGNYFFEGENIKSDVEKSKRAYRRRKNLDGLV